MVYIYIYKFIRLLKEKNQQNKIDKKKLIKEYLMMY